MNVPQSLWDLGAIGRPAVIYDLLGPRVHHASRIPRLLGLSIELP